MTIPRPTGQAKEARRRQRPVFVLEVPDCQALAFEADSLAEAQGVAAAPWFARAVTAFHPDARRACRLRRPRPLRTATETESSAYRDVATEFAEERSGLFVVRLAPR